MLLGEERIPRGNINLGRHQLSKKPVIPLLGPPTRLVHLPLRRFLIHRHRLHHLLPSLLLRTGIIIIIIINTDIRPQQPPEIRPEEKPGVGPLDPSDAVGGEEGRQTGVAGGETAAVLGEIVFEECTVVEEGGPVVLGRGGGPGEEGDGLEG